VPEFSNSDRTAAAKDDRLPNASPDAAFGRALPRQRYSLRRAWGFYYAIWGGVIGGVIGLPFAIAPWAGAHPSEGGIASAGIDIGLFVAAMLLSRWLFQTLLRTGGPDSWDSSPLPMPQAPGWLAVLVLLFLGVAASVQYQALILFFSSLVLVAALAARRQVESFGRLPSEGLWALGSFVGAAALSDGLLLTPYWRDYIWTWIPVVGVWLLAALFALYRAPEELGQEEPLISPENFFAFIAQGALRMIQSARYSKGRLFVFTGLYILLFAACAVSTLYAAVVAWGSYGWLLIAPYISFPLASAMVAEPYVRRTVRFDRSEDGRWYYSLPVLVPVLFLSLFVTRFGLELVQFGGLLLTSIFAPVSFSAGLSVLLVTVDCLLGVSLGLLFGQSLGVYQAFHRLPGRFVPTRPPRTSFQPAARG
jgi:hypothetical protein